jgi:UDPglucose--hexose-1-phosphate uridylyltransferase
VFDNDHPCVGPSAPDVAPPGGIYRARPARGLARVVCYSPIHDRALAELSQVEITELLSVWQRQFRELAGVPGVEHVLVFENKGEAVGCSNPHPHCQIYATNFVFKTIENELAIGERHFRHTGRGLFADVIEAEQRDGRRILVENASAIGFVPYFARYAYETYVAPKQAHPNLATLTERELVDLAAALGEVIVRYDNLWRMAFPYVLVLHQAPISLAAAPFFHFHIEIHPPLRKPNLLKHLAGPEIGGGSFLSDTVPEAKADELRKVSNVHYRAGRGTS